ncbi:hypothetical protein [Streptomyces sp. NPDC056452]|uniref:hypothetical protein n=1 Tax=Streptomyces sp. NPDC056452 TaxID=3345821 RepID=UPI0036B2A135
MSSIRMSSGSVPLAPAWSGLAFVHKGAHSLDEGDHGQYRGEHMPDGGGSF